MDRDHPSYDQAGGTRYGDAILDLHRKVAKALGCIIETLGDDVTVMVMSDHGFGPLHGVVNFNNLLRACGLLRLKRDPVARTKSWLFYRGLTPEMASAPRQSIVQPAVRRLYSGDAARKHM